MLFPESEVIAKLLPQYPHETIFSSVELSESFVFKAIIIGTNVIVNKIQKAIAAFFR